MPGMKMSVMRRSSLPACATATNPSAGLPASVTSKPRSISMSLRTILTSESSSTSKTAPFIEAPRVARPAF
jgi:hypothetical protein